MPSSFPTLSGTSLKEIKYQILNNLGSNSENHRLTLRTKLAEALKTAGLSEPKNTDDLNFPIQHNELSISLSHTDDASVFAWIEKPKKIGVDIELTERLTIPVLERVSTEKERNACPNIRYLWPAKEATFKAVSPLCQVISDIQTHSWQRIDDSNYLFSVSLYQSDQTIDGTGLVCLIPKHLVSFFVLQH